MADHKPKTEKMLTPIGKATVVPANVERPKTKSVRKNRQHLLEHLPVMKVVQATGAESGVNTMDSMRYVYQIRSRISAIKDPFALMLADQLIGMHQLIVFWQRRLAIQSDVPAIQSCLAVVVKLTAEFRKTSLALEALIPSAARHSPEVEAAIEQYFDELENNAESTPEIQDVANTVTATSPKTDEVDVGSLKSRSPRAELSVRERLEAAMSERNRRRRHGRNAGESSRRPRGVFEKA